MDGFDDLGVAGNLNRPRQYNIHEPRRISLPKDDIIRAVTYDGPNRAGKVAEVDLPMHRHIGSRLFVTDL